MAENGGRHALECHLALSRNRPDQGLARGVERVEHLGQRVVLSHVAGEHLGAAHEAAGVEHQGQGEQGAIGALVWSASTIFSVDDN